MKSDDEIPSVAQQATLGKLFEEHRDRLLMMLTRRIDPRLAVRMSPEEILHDAFLVAQHRWKELQDSSNTISQYAGLYRIAISGLKDKWQHENAQRRGLIPFQPRCLPMVRQDRLLSATPRSVLSVSS